MGQYKRRFPMRPPEDPARRGRDNAKVGDLVSQVLKAAGIGDSSQLTALRQAWLEAVGKQSAAQTRIVSLRNGLLTVEVASAALAQELSVYYKRQLLERLREAVRAPLTDLRCRVSGKSFSGDNGASGTRSGGAA
ncbi:DUF721 domain-containing protein [Planctomycetota bacterium]|nr:DUF721 domain-containing protein [Planctomycetota bacterium]